MNTADALFNVRLAVEQEAYRMTVYVDCAECGHLHYDSEARAFAMPCGEYSGVPDCDCHGQIDHSAEGNCDCYPQCWNAGDPEWDGRGPLE